ncbi:MAG TPA: glycosyltransferase [Geminicoccaceae bacterium]|nr:glycosyltransferase [Geminicoccus sp.]HMU49183.1 glycosyltransferase [Geminicoccaceae bacterium]
MAPDTSAAPRALLLEPQPFYTDRGTPIAVRQVLRALSELGWSVDVLTFPIGEPVDIPNVRVERVGNPLGFRHVAVGFSPQKVLLDLLMAGDLVRRLRRERYDVVHAVEETGFLAALLRGRGGPPIVYDMASSIPEQLARKGLLGAPPLRRSLEAAERWLLRKAGCVICSAGLGEHARAAAPAATVREWRFPAELDPAPPEAVAALRRQLGIPEGAPVVVYGGNFASYQGVDLLVRAANEALAAMPGAHLVCVGAADDGELAAAAALVSPAVADRVHLLERQPRQRVPLYLGLAGILVSPRSYGDNFPLKLFDYLAMGRPIVATRIKAHTCVLDERIACLAEPDAAGLAAALTRLLRQPDECARLAAAAAGYADRHLSWDGFKALVAEIYGLARASR